MLRESWLSSVRFVLIAPVPLNEPSSRGLVKFGRLKACGADVIVVLVVGVAVAAVAVAVVDATIKGAAVANGARVVLLAAVMLSQTCVVPVSAG